MSTVSRLPGPPLPVDDVLPGLVEALDANRPVVLQAPPGAGKTTRVPLALLDRPWLGDGRIVVLEPRRLAARASARRMASLLGERPGERVGYVTRDERVVSDRTRVEVVTEGILTRRLQRDPALRGVAAVLFDEFHERSLQADLGLALTLESREALRDDLRLVVMSATLEAKRVAGLLDGAVVLRSEGRLFPVETVHRDRPLGDRLEPHVVGAVREALAGSDGDVLVFLPGAGEIRRVARDLGAVVGTEVLVAPLYGALPPADQDRALDPAPHGRRKVVLATDIAETSLTIEGVRVVVDSGVTRESRFDANTGMSRLVTVRVSRASADQRRGRAGRVAPGVCYRLWSARDHAGLEPYHRPEIVQADLAGFVLEVARWGASSPDELRLLDPPPAATHGQAVALLTALGALDAGGRVTEHGHQLGELPVHPRLAHLVLAAPAQDRGLACEVAALLADRDVLSVGYRRSAADLTARVRVLRGGPPPAGTTVRRGALARARKEAARLRRLVEAPREGGGDVEHTGRVAALAHPDRIAVRPEGGGDVEHTGRVAALAYPDRIAVRREGQRGSFLLSNGRGATLPEDDVLAGEELLVVADVDAGRGEARIHLAAPIALDELRAAFGDETAHVEVVRWDDEAGDVVAEVQERVGAAVLGRRPLRPAPDAATTAALLDGVRARGLELLPWARAARELQARLVFLHRHLGADWPDVSDERLLRDLDGWLGPYLAGAHRRRDLERVALVDVLRHQVPPQQVRHIDELAPTHLTVPSGSRVRLDYEAEDGPVLPVKLQELFGATDTPRVAGGRVPVLVHLLSPAQRPVQVTRDLAGFWERGYPEVRAELRGRYPKHPWPEDPLTATPTKHTKPHP